LRVAWGDPRLPQRFWSKVRVEETTGCWVWTASRSSKRYGWFTHWRGRSRYAHRVAWEELVAPIPAGLQLDHLCRNPPCCNPAHLEPVTSRTNTLRGTSFAAAKAAQLVCVNGHLLVGANVRWRSDGRGRRVCRACEKQAARTKAEKRGRRAQSTASTQRHDGG
jgi:HNH endonuclease